MDNSILTSTKKILGIAANYTAFDLDVITHINTAFSTVNQLGIGPEEGFTIEDDSIEWVELAIPPKQLSMVKSYVFLRVRMLFDPPSTSFHIEAMNNQIKELEWRLSTFREEGIVLVPLLRSEEDCVW